MKLTLLPALILALCALSASDAHAMGGSRPTMKLPGPCIEKDTRNYARDLNLDLQSYYYYDSNNRPTHTVAYDFSNGLSYNPFYNKTFEYRSIPEGTEERVFWGVGRLTTTEVRELDHSGRLIRDQHYYRYKYDHKGRLVEKARGQEKTVYAHHPNGQLHSADVFNGSTLTGHIEYKLDRYGFIGESHYYEPTGGNPKWKWWKIEKFDYDAYGNLFRKTQIISLKDRELIDTWSYSFDCWDENGRYKPLKPGRSAD